MTVAMDPAPFSRARTSNKGREEKGREGEGDGEGKGRAAHPSLAPMALAAHALRTKAGHESDELLSFCLTGQKDGGTQIKLVIDYPHGAQALFKPMR